MSARDLGAARCARSPEGRGAEDDERVPSHGLLPGGRGADVAGQPVEDAVHVAMAVLAAERLGELHRFVDRDAGRYLESFDELEGADPKDRALHRIDLGYRAVQERLDAPVELLRRRDHPVEQLAEEAAVHRRRLLHEPVGEELALDLGRVLARHVPLVEGLDRRGAPPAAVLPRAAWPPSFRGGRSWTGPFSAGGGGAG